MHTHSIIYIKYSTNHNLFLNLQKLLIVMVMGTFTTRCLQCLHSFLKNKGKFSGMRWLYIKTKISKEYMSGSAVWIWKLCYPCILCQGKKQCIGLITPLHLVNHKLCQHKHTVHGKCTYLELILYLSMPVNTLWLCTSITVF